MGSAPIADLGPYPGYNIDPSMSISRFGINEGVPFHKRALIDPGFGDATLDMPEVVPGQSGLIWGAAILGGLLAIGGLVWRFYAVDKAASTASKFARR